LEADWDWEKDSDSLRFDFLNFPWFLPILFEF
jgi:hypothetical protein